MLRRSSALSKSERLRRSPRQLSAGRIQSYLSQRKANTMTAGTKTLLTLANLRRYELQIIKRMRLDQMMIASAKSKLSAK